MKRKDTSKADKIRMAFSQFTLVITLAFGFLTTLTLIEAPSKTLQSSFVQASVVGSRAPASVFTDPELKEKPKPYMSTMDLNCEVQKSLTTGSEHVRLKATHCRKPASDDLLNSGSTVVKNLTNGYTASVFSQGDERFTTDYVTLAAGKNQIVIEETDSTGKKSTRQIEILKE